MPKRTSADPVGESPDELIPDVGLSMDNYEGGDLSEPDDEFSDVIASLNPAHLEDLALTTRRLQFDVPSDLSCTVVLSPRIGSYNIVYETLFSDGIRWAIRVPGEVLTSAAARSMQLDIITQEFMSLKTSLPIPKIYRWSLDFDNPLSRPFVITDFMPGTNLSKLWHNKDWMTHEKRIHIFQQLANWMTELSLLEFEQIGRLDFDSITDTHRIIPFPDISALLLSGQDPADSDESSTIRAHADVNPSAGPFSSTHAYLSRKLMHRRQQSDSPMLGVLQLFLSALPDPTLDGPPFVLSHPDFEYQNVMVDHEGTITALIDWDGVFVGPRQGGAASYPSWLTVDWDPLFYGWRADASEEENAEFDSPSDLERYREMYLEAIDRASRGKLTPITRNSHIFESLDIGISKAIASSSIMHHLSKFVFGSASLVLNVKEGIKTSSWYNLDKGAIAQIRESSKSKSENSSSGPDSGNVSDSDMLDQDSMMRSVDNRSQHPRTTSFEREEKYLDASALYIDS
ncbi:unnamed protein product [Somion occarium]|uniref:Aminoglycoside phosphotransferase domain-containing protein n=1 Tax=Somion occarium TaxID=3059160 RepID=A0ABP1CM78_9APHY